MPPKKSDTPSTATKAKAAPAHPTYQDMISAAIVNLKERNGSSRQKLKMYVKANNQLGPGSDAQFDSLFNRALKAGVDKGFFVQPKGASGGTKLAKKAAVPKKESAAPKKPATEKKAAAPKKPVVAKKTGSAKKAAAPAKASAPKKPAAKKADAPVVVDKPKTLTKTKSGRVAKTTKPAAAKKATPKKAAAKKATPKKAAVSA